MPQCQGFWLHQGNREIQAITTDLQIASVTGMVEKKRLCGCCGTIAVGDCPTQGEVLFGDWGCKGFVPRLALS